MGTVEWIVLTFVISLAGAGLGFWLGKRVRVDDSEKLAAAEAELNAYRDRVTEHFSQSATHFQAIGRQYRDLYEHMAAGSEKLCERTESENQLQFPRPDEVAMVEMGTQTDATAAAEPGPADNVTGNDVDKRPPNKDEAAANTDSMPTGESALSSDDVDVTTAETTVEESDADPEPRLYH